MKMGPVASVSDLSMAADRQQEHQTRARNEISVAHVVLGDVPCSIFETFLFLATFSSFELLHVDGLYGLEKIEKNVNNKFL